MAKLSKIANEAVKKIDSKLECSICLDNFTEPKLLPCFHIFCKSPCLEKLVVRDHQRFTLTCPTCRHLVPLPDNGVNGLQTDFHIEHLFEIRQALEKAKNTKCENCSDQIATTYCCDCKFFLCQECTQMHNKWKKNTGHKIMGVDDVKPDVAGQLAPPIQPLMCDKHIDMEAKIYCETCSDMICNDCTIRLHRDHNYDLAKDVVHKHKKELLESLEQLKTNQATVENALAIFDTKTQEVTEQRAAVEADIHREIDQLHKLLDQQRVELVANLDMLTQQKLKELAAQRDSVELTQVKMSSCLKYAETGLETGTESEVLKMKRPVMKRVEQIMPELDPHTFQPQTKADIELVTDNIQKACRNFGEIARDPVIPESSYATGDGTKFAQAGKKMSLEVHPITRQNKLYEEPVMLKAEITHAKTNATIKCNIQQQNGQHSISYRPMFKGKHILTIYINKRHIQDSPYDIAVRPSQEGLRSPIQVVENIKPYGTVYNSKQQLIIADRYQNNAITILLEENKKQKIYDMGQKKPSRVTVDHEDNIYVTSFQYNYIVKISPKGEILGSIEKSGIKCDGPQGIEFNKSNHHIYVCDHNNHRILVLTTELELVKTFGTKGKENGQFACPRNLAFNSANNLYITERDNERVQVFTPDGQFLKAFNNKANGRKLENPYAIAIDSSNTVYISEGDLHCISVFTAEGEYITSFGGSGTKKGRFNYIYGLSIGEDDSILVSDSDNYRLQIF